LLSWARMVPSLFCGWQISGWHHGAIMLCSRLLWPYRAAMFFSLLVGFVRSSLPPTGHHTLMLSSFRGLVPLFLVGVQSAALAVSLRSQSVVGFQDTLETPVAIASGVITRLVVMLVQGIIILMVVGRLQS
jgi:hypothetical protein